jgi:MFS family permease
MPRNKFLLPLIVFSQFAGTSLWFVGNAIIADIQTTVASNVSNLTSVVQFGFIGGTLIFSLLTIADRFSPSKVFFFSSLIAATANVLLLWFAKDSQWLFILRFITGFFLAGIYPVGMKIAADNFPNKLGNAMGFLVGALVLGTAFPHLVKSQLQIFAWQDVVIFSSALASAGGLLVLLFVPGQKTKAPASALKLNAAIKVFASSNFRSAAFGYFGHMWELYTFWAFVPLMLATYNAINQDSLNISLWAFIVIAAGSLSCTAGGVLSKKYGSKKIAFYSLFFSGICCLLSPLFNNLPEEIFLSILLIWGLTVVSDSPQFSAMVAQSAPPENKGTALTIVTSAGFAITIISMQVVRALADIPTTYYLLVLFIGPFFGLFSLKNYRQHVPSR